MIPYNELHSVAPFHRVIFIVVDRVAIMSRIANNACDLCSSLAFTTQTFLLLLIHFQTVLILFCKFICRQFFTSVFSFQFVISALFFLTKHFWFPVYLKDLDFGISKTFLKHCNWFYFFIFLFLKVFLYQFWNYFYWVTYKNKKLMN